ncbi:MAG: tetratricopeptide repeat protein [Fibrobacter sp.]|uniref:tetratricopeptide repeat protein n=1 Tax=Fibrobacter sp. TaxID=35828 RepID=UPI00388F459E|nr:tetratricopeptide repeat protein [Fibrobacter sp.]
MANESNSNNSEIKEFFVQHGTKVLVVLVIILVVVAGVVQFKDARKAAAAEQAEMLGKGMTFLYTNENDSALVEFEAQISAGKIEGLALAKAALFAGNIKFGKGDFDGAAVLYQKSLDNAGSVVLVRSAAMHGLAAVKIEKGDYSAAAGLLEKYVSEFAKRTGDKEDRFQKEEPIDEVPMVADAMWKLVLVYQQLGANDKAKNMAERLLQVYGDNQGYADRAKKFIAAL